MHRAATNITELYAPQFEQFGLELTGKGAVFTGEVANDRAHGRAWIMPLSPACIVMEHFITPTHDMYLAEYTPEPYACVSEVSAPTLTCMPEAGITPANLKPLHGPWPNNAVCSFIQDSCGEELSPLFAGELYHSRSVLFLPGYFDELEHRYPTEFAGIFEAFAESWHEEAASAASFDVLVTCNAEWRAEVSPEDEAWLSLGERTATRLNVVCAVNDTGASREGAVRLYIPGTACEVSLAVKQSNN